MISNSKKVNLDNKVLNILNDLKYLRIGYNIYEIL